MLPTFRVQTGCYNSRYLPGNGGKERVRGGGEHMAAVFKGVFWKLVWLFCLQVLVQDLIAWPH